ncbi:hypothetical protein [uncultured Agrobacterium sp.]|uniref:hypothetical protein n=1 Tax=uncultured Agrobacterium sp. TaxID=157277 RepID=UPI0025F8CA50|nr:hypothetical protein [uncultured Agrobacterium sp.]
MGIFNQGFVDKDGICKMDTYPARNPIEHRGLRENLGRQCLQRILYERQRQASNGDVGHRRGFAGLRLILAKVFLRHVSALHIAMTAKMVFKVYTLF